MTDERKPRFDMESYATLVRIERKLRAEFEVVIQHPIPLGAHPLIEHLLGHGAATLRPVKGCRLCGLLKAHELLVEVIEEDAGGQLGGQLG